MTEKLLLSESLYLLIPTLFLMSIPYFFRTYFHFNEWGEVKLLHPLSNESSLPKNSRESFFDFLKGIAISAVVLIHITYIYMHDSTIYYPSATYFYLNNFTNGILRFTIPFFLLCSGILITPFSFTPNKFLAFYATRALQLLPPYLFITYFIDYEKSGELWFQNMISGQTDIPFYFMIILFQCYLLYPLLQLIRPIKAAMPILFFLSLYFGLYPENDYAGTIPLCFKYLFFFYYGMCTRDYFLQSERSGQKTLSKKEKGEMALWGGLILFCTIFITIYSQRYYNSQYFFGIACFHLAFTLRQKFSFNVNSLFTRGIAFLGKSSLWIFLTHFQILLLFEKEVLPAEIGPYLRQLYVFVLGFGSTILLSTLFYYSYNFVTSKILSLFRSELKKSDKSNMTSKDKKAA